MKLKNFNLTLNQRLLLLLGFFAVGMLVLYTSSMVLEKRMNQKVVFPNFESQLLNSHKLNLKSLVDVEAQVLALRLKAAKSREEQLAIITTETDAVRYFDDRSGYYFTYDSSGVRINVPINKSANGQNCLDLKDKRNFYFVKSIVDVAKAGGGYSEYYFEKEGKGIQPKLSYSAMIPGTEFLIGAGVYIDDVQAERAALAAKVADQSRQYLYLMVGLFVLILAVTLAVAMMLSRSITHLVKGVADSLLASAGQVAMASTQLSQTSQSLAAGSSEQAASIEETSASLEEASSTTQRNAENVNTAKDLARQTRSSADLGAADMQAMSQAMEAIKSSSNDIAKIIKTIDEIAFQTNILALNAAVEAARAGEAGMGFAVVADEVRSLAQRSAQAAKETAAMIAGAINNTGQGVAITSKVAMALNEILAKARQMDDLAGEIAAASQEQANGIGQINQAVGQMDKITQSNAAAAEENAASAEELSAQAAIMKQSVMDLLKLVGGADHLVVAESPEPSPVRRAHTLARKPASVPMNGAAKRNGSATPRRQTAPVGDDFKNF